MKALGSSHTLIVSGEPLVEFLVQISGLTPSKKHNFAIRSSFDFNSFLFLKRKFKKNRPVQYSELL